MDKAKEISVLWKQIKPQIGELARLCHEVESHYEVTADAYQRGYENGFITGHLKAEKSGQSFYEDGYRCGLNDAWDAAKKTAYYWIWSGGTNEAEEIFGTDDIIAIFKGYSASEAIEKIRQYEQENEEKITKGDVVRIKSTPEIEIFVTYADDEHVSGIALTEVDGCCEIGDQYTGIVIHKVEKTGRHYEIAEVLQKMQKVMGK